MDINWTANGAELIQLTDSFPCMFNLASVKKPSHSRLRFLLEKLKQEVEQQQQDFESEKVNILNVMCWIHFQFGEINKAKEKNDEALEMSPQSLMSLGNQIYLNWHSNADLTTYQQRLEKLKAKSEFENETLKATAGQGYFLLRLSGEYNLSSSFQLFTELTQRRPENYTWKYFQGLASRRAETIRGNKVEKKSKDIFSDITENSKDEYLKSLAFSELAFLLAVDRDVSLARVKTHIEKALSLNSKNARIFRSCGAALRSRKNSEAIIYLKQAIDAKPNNAASHKALAKCYADSTITKYMNRSECYEQAISHFKKAFHESLGSNFECLFDLAFMYRKTKKNEDCEDLCRILSKCWRLENVLINPFHVAKVYENMNYAMREYENDFEDELSDRYLSMALITSLEFLKHRGSREDKCGAYDQIVDPSQNNLNGDRITYHLFVLFNWCKNPRGARQILVKLIREGGLGEEEVEREICQLLAEHRPDQALLILDILDLANVPAVSEKLERQVTLDEAKWELSNGQIACKLLFHRMFNKSYSGRQTSYPEEKDEGEHRGADVLILYDAPQWKFFFQVDIEDTREDAESMKHDAMYENILYHLFDLEVISNPWMPLSVESSVGDEFFALVQRNNIKLILLLTGKHTSDQFLKMADSVLGTILTDTTPTAAAMSTVNTPDVAIISCDGRDCSQKLRDARHFDAHKNGVMRRLEFLPSDDLSGTEIIDAFFSGNVESAMKLFEFLAPPKCSDGLAIIP